MNDQGPHDRRPKRSRHRPRAAAPAPPSQAVVALKVLANAERLLLLCQLSQGEMCVGELEEQLGHPPADAVAAARRAAQRRAWSSTRREGKNIYYSVADPTLLEILAVLYRLYCPKE